MTTTLQSNDKAITLHAGQTEAFCSTARFIAMICGTGGGKTYFGPWWCMHQIGLHPRGRGLVVSPTFDMLRREARREFRTRCAFEYEEYSGGV